MYSCDSSCQLKRHVSSQFTSSLFPLHLRHLLNCSYQMHMQIEKLIMYVCLILEKGTYLRIPTIG